MNHLGSLTVRWRNCAEELRSEGLLTSAAAYDACAAELDAWLTSLHAEYRDRFGPGRTNRNERTTP